MTESYPGPLSASSDACLNDSTILDFSVDDAAPLVLSMPSYVISPSLSTLNLPSAFETGDTDPLGSPSACSKLVHCLTSLFDDISATESTLCGRKQDLMHSQVGSSPDLPNLMSTLAAFSPLDNTMTQTSFDKPQSPLDIVTKPQSFSAKPLASSSDNSGSDKSLRRPYELGKARVLSTPATFSPLDTATTQMTVARLPSRLDAVAKLQSCFTRPLAPLSTNCGSDEPLQCPCELQKAHVLMTLASF